MTFALDQDNPFARPSTLPYGLPDYTAIREEHYLPAFLAGMAEQRAEVAAIAGSPQAPTVENTLVALERSGRLLDRVSNAFYNQLSSDATPALEALEDQVAPLLQISEVRTIAGDDLWLSTAHGGPHVGLHFTWKPWRDEVEQVLPVLEDALAPLQARPHWGKLFADRDRRLADLYPRWDDARALIARRDPAGVFANDFVRRIGLRD